MSLYLMATKENPVTYSNFGICWASPPMYYPVMYSTIYNKHLVTCPRTYSEEIKTVKGFFYVPPPEDVLVLWTYTTQVRWPSWGVQFWNFDAATGDLISRTNVGSVYSILYINNMEWGDLGHLYATFSSTSTIRQVNWKTGVYESWNFNPYSSSWSPKRIFSQLLVDRQNDKILAVNYPYLEVWTNVKVGTPTMVWQMRIPNTVSDLAYESNYYGWILTTDGKVLKIDWGTNYRIEMVSTVQFDSTDLGRWLAYDSYRRRLAVFRLKPNATDGAARNSIEFYETIPKAVGLTEPVPVNSIKTDGYTKFVANLIGDMGEGLGGKEVEVSLVAPNNHGSILSPHIFSGINGELIMSYRAPSTANTDTIKIATDVREDIGPGVY